MGFTMTTARFAGGPLDGSVLQLPPHAGTDEPAEWMDVEALYPRPWGRRGERGSIERNDDGEEDVERVTVRYLRTVSPLDDGPLWVYVLEEGQGR